MNKCLAFVHANGYHAANRFIPREVVVASLKDLDLIEIVVKIEKFKGLESVKEARSNAHNTEWLHRLVPLDQLLCDNEQDIPWCELEDLASKLNNIWKTLRVDDDDAFFVCKGQAQLEFFREECHLPVKDVETLVSRAFLPTVHEMVTHECQHLQMAPPTHVGIHCKDDTSRCSVRIAWYFARHLAHLRRDVPSVQWKYSPPMTGQSSSSRRRRGRLSGGTLQLQQPRRQLPQSLDDWREPQQPRRQLPQSLDDWREPQQQPRRQLPQSLDDWRETQQQPRRQLPQSLDDWREPQQQLRRQLPQSLDDWRETQQQQQPRRQLPQSLDDWREPQQQQQLRRQLPQSLDDLREPQQQQPPQRLADGTIIGSVTILVKL